MAADGGAASNGVDSLFPTRKDIKDQASNEDTASCPFDHIPPEMRNEIFMFALVHDRPVEITERLPGLTGTCKRFREEALAIYFGNNTFLARVIDFDEAPLITWLDKLSSFWSSYKPLIPEVQVLSEGLPVENTAVYPQKIPPCFPNYECWDNIIARLGDSGFAASRIKWPSALLINIEANAWPGLKDHRYPFPTQSAIEATIHSHILPWLLKRHSFYDEEKPPVDVMRRLQDKYGKKVAAWIDVHRHRAGGCHSRDLANQKAWWKKPVDEDPGRQERIQKYQEFRQGEKDRKARTKRMLQDREDRRVQMQALLDNESYIRTQASPDETHSPLR